MTATGRIYFCLLGRDKLNSVWKIFVFGPCICLQIFCENWQNPVKQRITPHFLTTSPSNYYEFTTKE